MRYWNNGFLEKNLREIDGRNCMENKVVYPQDGGCWFCFKKTEDMWFDSEFDTFLHEECLRKELNDNPENPEARIMKYLLE